MEQTRVSQKIPPGSVVVVAVYSPDPALPDEIKFASLRWPGEWMPQPGEILPELEGARVAALFQVTLPGEEGNLAVKNLQLLDLYVGAGGFVTHLGEAFVEAYRNALEHRELLAF